MGTPMTNTAVVAPPKKARAKKLHEASEPADSDTAALITAVTKASRDPTVDIVKMQFLLDTARSLRAEASEREANLAMAKVQAEMVPVVRNRPNPFTGSDYADIAALHETVMPLVHEAGFGLSFYEVPARKDGFIGIGVKLMHSAGHSEEREFQVPIDAGGMRGGSNKSPAQAYGSSLTYGRRYATLCVFNVPIASQDKDGNRLRPQTHAEPPIERAPHTRKAMGLGAGKPALEASLKLITKEQLA